MPPRRLRLDQELVRRGIARSREHASALVNEGKVKVQGVRATKPATGVTTDVAIVVDVDPAETQYASRGAHKLLGALEAFVPQGLVVEGRRALDAGASTGGFTDVLLQRGAREVVAVDVGYGQLIWRLQNDDRVQVHDRTNIRDLTLDLISGPVDLVVGDLSFISLGLVLPALVGVAAPDADLALMVKPQFEVGKDRIGKGGVVRDPELRAEVVLDVSAQAARLGWGTRAVATSPLPGPSGNVEFFLWLRRGESTVSEAAVRAEVLRGSADPSAAPLDHRAVEDAVEEPGRVSDPSERVDR